MVATDVASRGIGKYYLPPSPPYLVLLPSKVVSNARQSVAVLYSCV